LYPNEITTGGCTPLWASPEMLDVFMAPTPAIKQTKAKKVGPKTDVYSFGYVMWQMLFSFYQKKHADLYAGIASLEELQKTLSDPSKRPPLPSECSPLLNKLLHSCWIYDVETRVNSEDLVNELQKIRDQLGNVAKVEFTGPKNFAWVGVGTFTKQPPLLGEHLPLKSAYLTEINKPLDTFATEDKKKILIITPSIYVPGVEVIVQKLSQAASEASNPCVVLVITQDMPWHLTHYCKKDKIKKSDNIGVFYSFGKESRFGQVVGLELSGPLTNLMALGLFVLDKDNVVRYREVPHSIPFNPKYSVLKQHL